MANQTKNASGGMSLCGVLTIVFVILKLTNNINWSWLWVLSPVWLPVALIVAGFLVYLLIKSIVR